MSLFTFSAPLCKCHYSMLSEDDNNNNNNKKTKNKRRGLKNESLYTFVKGAERDSHFGSRIDLSSLPLVKKKKSKQNVKSRTVSRVSMCRVVCPSVCLAIKTPHTPVEKLLIFRRTGVLVLLWVLKCFPRLQKKKKRKK